MLKKSKEHLEETGMGYWGHLRHAFKQSNLLIGVAVRSYLHGIFPNIWISYGPKKIIKVYRHIKRFKHHRHLFKD
ncbi:MAG: hypothetical protein CMD98_06360 [Gammaproteobacteria bacterium]|nr:hypothetical protein [Gammaproteobacteria bacterium]|tara:strand:- start:5138 stop:5362 length:225 start_codon:yes stop_codon:yes gene_type:complete